MTRIIKLSIVLLTTLFFVGCEHFEDQGGNNGSSDFPRPEDLKPEDLGKHGQEINYVHVDLEGAQALLTLEDTGSISNSSALTHGIIKLPQTATSDTNPLWKWLSDGKVKEALRNFGTEANDAFAEVDTAGLESEKIKKLPHISYMAVSAYDEVYVVFQNPFIFRDKATVKGNVVKIDDYENPWESSSPFTCQFFKVNQKLTDYGTADQIKKSNLTCITDSLEMDTWDPRAGAIQFDDAGNVYFTAHVPGNWKSILLKLDRQSLLDGEIKLTEVINANIRFRDYLVTNLGGVLYTGQTSTDGKDGGGGSSFFRFVTPTGALKEVVRDWWEYTFEPIVRGTDAGKLIFYGPNTLTSTVPGWNSACLYKFDPAKDDDPDTASVDERSTDIATCRNDVWGYVNDQSVATTVRKSRCEENSYYLGSGESPKDIMLSNIDTDADDEVMIVAKVRHKKPGTWYCNVCINPTQAHCVKDGKIVAVGACTSAGQGDTVTDAQNDRCYTDITTSSICTSTNANVRFNNNECRQPGDNWTEEISGIALVKDDKSINLLSATSESVVRSWVINSVIYFSSYATGTYRLKKVTFDSNNNATVTTLLNNYEIYKLTPDPANKDKLLINGLSFSDNSYVMGTFDPTASSPQATLSTRSELTGVIDTILIFQ